MKYSCNVFIYDELFQWYGVLFCIHCGFYEVYEIVRFEKLDITPKSAQKIKPVLERWMEMAEERYKNGMQNLSEFIGLEPSKKRKRRTSFTPQALELLNEHFEQSTHPSGIYFIVLILFCIFLCWHFWFKLIWRSVLLLVSKFKRRVNHFNTFTGHNAILRPVYVI